MARFTYRVEWVIPVTIEAEDADEARGKLEAIPFGEILYKFSAGEPKMTVPLEPVLVVV